MRWLGLVGERGGASLVGRGVCVGGVCVGAGVASDCQSIDSCSLGFSDSTANAVATLVPTQADRELHRVAYGPRTKTEHPPPVLDRVKLDRRETSQGEPNGKASRFFELGLRNLLQEAAWTMSM